MRHVRLAWLLSLAFAACSNGNTSTNPPNTTPTTGGIKGIATLDGMATGDSGIVVGVLGGALGYTDDAGNWAIGRSAGRHRHAAGDLRRLHAGGHHGDRGRGHRHDGSAAEPHTDRDDADRRAQRPRLLVRHQRRRRLDRDAVAERRHGDERRRRQLVDRQRRRRRLQRHLRAHGLRLANRRQRRGRRQRRRHGAGRDAAP